ncbi:hypothetical protein [Carboxylicivirga caseinilyticus]|uniref:hypothetical protein n=1 Tax=Carboxylicivirga caseinilyticus TaxID=3417572 RepID=UPI003D326224|nr:hypothetical protein [Marinilabiliaceae bacterium A049]
MKSLTLLTLLALLGMSEARAQTTKIASTDTISAPLLLKPFQKPQGLNHQIKYQDNLKDLLNNLKVDKTDRQFSQHLIQTDQVKGNVQSMPCYKPEGDYPMLVFQPDTTVNYSLLIKEY